MWQNYRRRREDVGCQSGASTSWSRPSFFLQIGVLPSSGRPCSTSRPSRRYGKPKPRSARSGWLRARAPLASHDQLTRALAAAPSVTGGPEKPGDDLVQAGQPFPLRKQHAFRCGARRSTRCRRYPHHDRRHARQPSGRSSEDPRVPTAGEMRYEYAARNGSVAVGACFETPRSDAPQCRVIL